MKMICWLGENYLWVKASHRIFVIFWVAGMFMLPRFFVDHHGVAPGSAEDGLWIERERRLLRIIINPAMAATWILGLMLAFTYGWSEGWLHDKLVLVLLLSGFQGLLSGLRRSVARGERGVGGRAWGKRRVGKEVITECES